MINIKPELIHGLPDAYEDKVTQIMMKDAALNASIPPTIRKRVEWLLRMVNSFYSNKIEGNPTHPKAFLATQDASASKLGEDHYIAELLASLEVQLKESKVTDKSEHVCSEETIKAIHKAFYDKLPPESRVIKNQVGEIAEDKDGNPRMIHPGEYRKFDVIVGQHEALPHEEVPRYMRWVAQMYDKKHHGTKAITAAAYFHHRACWVHPFEDGNGRTIRIVTDMLMRKAGLGGYGLWSLARGFGRDRHAYYKYLAIADKPPLQPPVDGVGLLSDKGLRQWVEYFIDTCLDQVQFFTDILEPHKLSQRINIYFDYRAQGAFPSIQGVDLPKLDIRAREIYKLLLENGPMSRSDIAKHFGKTEQTLRKVINQMDNEGLVDAKPKKSVEVLLAPHSIETFFPSIFS